MTSDNVPHCDPETGLCTPAALAPAAAPLPELRDDVEIIYVGDPMCSWCWGISPALHRLEVRARREGIPYRIVVGGLRPDDSQSWDQEFRKFLRHHWEEVNQRSGQPFGTSLFDRAAFSYNTEPSCRAVVAARLIDPAVESRFFELVQYGFYVKNEDPGELEFYRSVCEETGIDFDRFAETFVSQEARRLTLIDFRTNRSWGVTGYPTVIFRKGDQLTAIARGFSTFENLWAAVEELSGEAG